MQTPFFTILTQTPIATRNVAEFYRTKFCRQTKLIAVSQKWPTNILKPILFSTDLESLSCVLNAMFPFSEYSWRFDDHGFAFHNSVTFVHSGKHCCMEK